MWLIICWLVGLPKILYHLLLTLSVLIWYLSYKVFGTTCPPALVQYQQHQEYQQNFASQQSSQRHHFTGQLKDKVKLVLMKSSMAFRETQHQLQAGRSCNQVSQNFVRSNSIDDKNRSVSQLYLSSLAAVFIVALICLSQCPAQTHCLEEDAELLQPIAGLAKSVIKTITLGVPLEMHLDLTGLPRNFAKFTWRTGFPVTMPRGFIEKAQDFYNRVKRRVDQTEVLNVERKTFAKVKLDMDKIVDSIVEEVRQSPDGLYTDYLMTRVDGVPLEDACTNLGLQLKAYGVDINTYHKLAKSVLGIPVLPTVASTMTDVVNLANLNTVKNLTQSITNSAPLSPATNFLNNLHDNAMSSVSQVSTRALGSIGALSDQLPMQNIVKATPLSPQFWRPLQSSQLPGVFSANPPVAAK